MEARMNQYKEDFKEAGKELMVSGMKLRSPHGKLKTTLKFLTDFPDGVLFLSSQSAFCCVNG